MHILFLSLARYPKSINVQLSTEMLLIYPYLPSISKNILI